MPFDKSTPQGFTVMPRALQLFLALMLCLAVSGQATAAIDKSTSSTSLTLNTRRAPIQRKHCSILASPRSMTVFHSPTPTTPCFRKFATLRLSIFPTNWVKC